MADMRPHVEVSAIIVVLNGERFLAEAIESILEQTFLDWELVVVDDGSTDNSRDIVRFYQSRSLNPILLLQHESAGNRGIAASRNLGMSKARGKYVAFLDADDVWLPCKLTDQVAIMNADQDLSMVYGRTMVWHSWSSTNPSPDYFYPLGVQPGQRYNPPILFQLLMDNKAQSPTVCNAMLRASLIWKVGAFDEAFRGMFEDLTCFARLLAIAPAYVSDHIWAHYRQHCASTTALSSAQGLDNELRSQFLAWLAHALMPLRPAWRVRFALRRQRVVMSLKLFRQDIRAFKQRFR